MLETLVERGITADLWAQVMAELRGGQALAMLQAKG